MSIVLLQETSTGSGIMSYLSLVGMVLIFYFFFIRPQQKKQKETKKYLEAIKKGDLAITAGGIHGKIVEVTDTTVTLDVDRGTKLVFEKASLSLDASKKMNAK